MSAELQIVPASHRELVLSPVMNLDVARERMRQFEEFVAHYLQPSLDGGTDGGDFGPIPGAGKKKVLLKSGADKLTELYGLYDEYIVEAIENFETKLFYYKITCILKSRRDDSKVGEGLGSCSTYESKYRWRDSQRVCPKCEAAAIMFGKEEYIKQDGLGYYLCFKKKGGCGLLFKKGDQSIEAQVVGRVENPDILDTVNTVLKMAKKRAKIDAVIGVTRSSGIFTQDLEDVPMPPPSNAPVERTTEDVPLKRAVADIRDAVSGKYRNQGASDAIADVKEILTEIGSPAKEAAPVKGGADGQPEPANAPDKETAELTQSLGRPPVEEIAEQAKAAMSPKEGTVTGDCISVGQQTNLHRGFRSVLRKELQKQADDLLRNYLKQQGIVDSNGEGTARAILKANFYEVRNACEEHARSL